MKKQKFIELYKTNTVTELCKKIDLSKPVVIRLAKELGLRKKKSGRIKKEMTLSKEEFAQRYYSTKTTTLARQLRVSTSTIVKYAHSFGLEMKKPGWGLRDKKKFELED